MEIAYSHQEIEAVKATADVAKLLQVAVDEPMLFVHSMTYSPAAKPILYDCSFYRADKYTFKNTLIRQKGVNKLKKSKSMIDEHWEEFLEFLQTVMKVPSVKGEPEDHAPFGKAPREVLDLVLKKGKEVGLRLK